MVAKFLDICWPSLPFECTWNFLISRARFVEHVNTTQNYLFLNGHFRFNSRKSPEKFVNILSTQMKWIRSMKSKTVWIHFSSDVFSLLSSRNFATLATWRNDFSCPLKAQQLALFRERLSEKVHATIPKGFVSGFVFIFFQRNLKEHRWYICEC